MRQAFLNILSWTLQNVHEIMRYRSGSLFNMIVKITIPNRAKG